MSVPWCLAGEAGVTVLVLLTVQVLQLQRYLQLVEIIVTVLQLQCYNCWRSYLPATELIPTMATVV